MAEVPGFFVFILDCWWWKRFAYLITTIFFCSWIQRKQITSFFLSSWVPKMQRPQTTNDMSATSTGVIFISNSMKRIWKIVLSSIKRHTEGQLHFLLNVLAIPSRNGTCIKELCAYQRNCTSFHFIISQQKRKRANKYVSQTKRITGGEQGGIRKSICFYSINQYQRELKETHLLDTHVV